MPSLLYVYSDYIFANDDRLKKTYTLLTAFILQKTARIHSSLFSLVCPQYVFKLKF